jgi:hypothetical protein
MKVFPTGEVCYEPMVELVARLTRAAALLDQALDDPRDQATVAGEWKMGRAAEEVLIDAHAHLGALASPEIDRGDLAELSAWVEAAVSQVEDAAEAVAGYSAGEPDAAARRLSAVALRSTEALRGAVAEMRSPRRLMRRLAGDLRPLQVEADRLYAAAMDSLVVGHPDIMHAPRRKAVYDLLQATVRICQETGGMLERIAIRGW